MNCVQGGTAPYNQARLLAEEFEGEVRRLMSAGGFTVGELDATKALLKAVQIYKEVR